MPPYETIANFVYDAYVFPAMARGDEKVSVRVTDVWRGLDGAFGLGEIHEVLASKRFRDLFLLALASKDCSSFQIPTEYTFVLKNRWSPPSNRPS